MCYEKKIVSHSTFLYTIFEHLISGINQTTTNISQLICHCANAVKKSDTSHASAYPIQPSYVAGNYTFFSISFLLNNNKTLGPSLEKVGQSETAQQAPLWAFPLQLISIKCHE